MDGKEHFPDAFGNLLFPKIFQTFQIAVQLSKLIIALLAVGIICLAGWIMDFSKTVVATPSTQGKTTELQIYIAGPEQLESYLESCKTTGERTGLFTTLWHFASEKFHGALNSLFELNFASVIANIAEYVQALKWAFRYHFIYLTIFLIIKLVVISIAGGAICRAAAMQFARGERPGVGEALRFSIKKFKSFFAAPLVPAVVIILAGLPVFLLGLVCNIPRLGELITGIFMPAVLTAGLLTAVVIIGTIAGFNLMFPAIAYDNSNCLDAISRSFSYVYARPWRMGFYTAVAAVYGAICYTFVRFLAFLLLSAAYVFLRLGIGKHSDGNQLDKLTAIWPAPSFINLAGQTTQTINNWSQSIAAFLVRLNVWVVAGLAISFVISFYFSANAIIYPLMRNRLDNTALEEVYVPAENSETDSSSQP